MMFLSIFGTDISWRQRISASPYHWVPVDTEESTIVETNWRGLHPRAKDEGYLIALAALDACRLPVINQVYFSGEGSDGFRIRSKYHHQK